MAHLAPLSVGCPTVPFLFPFAFVGCAIKRHPPASFFFYFIAPFSPQIVGRYLSPKLAPTSSFPPCVVPSLSPKDQRLALFFLWFTCYLGFQLVCFPSPSMAHLLCSHNRHCMRHHFQPNPKPLPLSSIQTPHHRAPAGLLNYLVTSLLLAHHRRPAGLLPRGQAPPPPRPLDGGRVPHAHALRQKVRRVEPRSRLLGALLPLRDAVSWVHAPLAAALNSVSSFAAAFLTPLAPLSKEHRRAVWRRAFAPLCLCVALSLSDPLPHAPSCHGWSG